MGKRAAYKRQTESRQPYPQEKPQSSQASSLLADSFKSGSSGRWVSGGKKYHFVILYDFEGSGQNHIKGEPIVQN